MYFSLRFTLIFVLIVFVVLLVKFMKNTTRRFVLLRGVFKV